MTNHIDNPSLSTNSTASLSGCDKADDHLTVKLVAHIISPYNFKHNKKLTRYEIVDGPIQVLAHFPQFITDFDTLAQLSRYGYTLLITSSFTQLPLIKYVDRTDLVNEDS